MILAVLQARVSSSRLPGKVLKPILGQPMLLRQIERIQRARSIERLVVATSTDATDDPLAALCESRGLSCFRGSLMDVLDRFHGAASATKPDHVMRLTGDCPLTDPAVIDRVAAIHLSEGNDYTSNALEPSFPDGLDVEVMKYSVLEEAWREATLPSQREHVSLFIYQQPSRFRLGRVASPVDLSHLRWTVDEHADFEFVTKVYCDLYPGNPDFTTEDILRWTDRNPEAANLNRGLLRNAGLKSSLERDR